MPLYIRPAPYLFRKSTAICLFSLIASIPPASLNSVFEMETNTGRCCSRVHIAKAIVLSALLSQPIEVIWLVFILYTLYVLRAILLFVI